MGNPARTGLRLPERAGLPPATEKATMAARKAAKHRRAGRSLSAEQRRILNRAKEALRQQFGRE